VEVKMQYVKKCLDDIRDNVGAYSVGITFSSDFMTLCMEFIDDDGELIERKSTYYLKGMDFEKEIKGIIDALIDSTPKFLEVRYEL
jgi:hypothetical protein